MDFENLNGDKRDKCPATQNYQDPAGTNEFNWVGRNSRPVVGVFMGTPTTTPRRPTSQLWGKGDCFVFCVNRGGFFFFSSRGKPKPGVETCVGLFALLAWVRRPWDTEEKGFSQTIPRSVSAGVGGYRFFFLPGDFFGFVVEWAPR